MSSTMITSYMDFNETLHKDFTMPTISARNCIDIKIFPRGVVAADKLDLPSAFRPANGNNSSSDRHAIARRHSSSVYSAASFAASTTPTLAASFAYPPSSAGSLTSAPLETVVEVSKSFESSSFEKFRNRAYSEGSQQLGVADAQQQQQQQPTVTSRYKTELCRPFEESGRCKYGDKCQFAHGKQELRHLQRHPKYKTELCRTYHTSGLCPYGPRCHFIHNQEVEPSSSAGMQQQQQQSSPSPFTSALQMHMETQPPTVTRLQAGPRPGNLRILPPLPPAHSQKAVKLAAGGQGFYAASPVASTPPGFEALTAGDSANLLSPISPMTTGSGGAGQFFGVGMIENRQATPPLTQFDVFAAASAASSSQMLDASFSDDGVFDGPPTPPDSDRESNTGSPRSGATAAAVGGQRLPIFRNLSKSD